MKHEVRLHRFSWRIALGLRPVEPAGRPPPQCRRTHARTSCNTRLTPMTNDTPRKQKRREKLIQHFSEDWTYEISDVPTIRYRRHSGLKGIWQRLFGRKHTIFALYWFFKHEYRLNEELRKFQFPVAHDNMPVQGFPFKYEMHGRWHIDDDDLKYLYGGPLIDQQGELMVPVDGGVKKAQRIAKLVTPFIALVSALLLFLYRALQLGTVL